MPGHHPPGGRDAALAGPLPRGGPQRRAPGQPPHGGGAGPDNRRPAAARSRSLARDHASLITGSLAARSGWSLGSPRWMDAALPGKYDGQVDQVSVLVAGPADQILDEVGGGREGLPGPGSPACPRSAASRSPPHVRGPVTRMAPGSGIAGSWAFGPGNERSAAGPVPSRRCRGHPARHRSRHRPRRRSRELTEIRGSPAAIPVMLDQPARSVKGLGPAFLHRRQVFARTVPAPDHPVDRMAGTPPPAGCCPRASPEFRRG